MLDNIHKPTKWHRVDVGEMGLTIKLLTKESCVQGLKPASGLMVKCSNLANWMMNWSRMCSTNFTWWIIPGLPCFNCPYTSVHCVMLSMQTEVRQCRKIGILALANLRTIFITLEFASPSVLLILSPKAACDTTITCRRCGLNFRVTETKPWGTEEPRAC